MQVGEKNHIISLDSAPYMLTDSSVSLTYPACHKWQTLVTNRALSSSLPLSLTDPTTETLTDTHRNGEIQTAHPTDPLPRCTPILQISNIHCRDRHAHARALTGCIVFLWPQRTWYHQLNDALQPHQGGNNSCPIILSSHQDLVNHSSFDPVSNIHLSIILLFTPKPEQPLCMLLILK